MVDAATLINCAKHTTPRDIYCTACSTFLCAECVSDHGTESHKPKYMYILQYAPSVVLPKLHTLFKSASEQARNAESDYEELQAGLKEMLPLLKDAAEEHAQSAAYLKALGAKLMSCSKQKIKGNCVDNMTAVLKDDKDMLMKAVTEKKLKDAIRLAQKLEEEMDLVSKHTTAVDLLERLKAQLAELDRIDLIKGVVTAAGKIATKYSLMKITRYVSDWKCDRKYLSSKMSLSEDCLTYGNTASSGYPAIIGDVPFDNATYAFEVIPENLDCTKEGFGIIEADKYYAAQKSDSVTPTVYDNMLGYFYNGTAKNMTSTKICEIKSGSKYFVRVDMTNLTMSLTGPGVALSATLNPGTVYFPCFSCGCTKNKIKIRPLISFDEPDPSEGS